MSSQEWVLRSEAEIMSCRKAKHYRRARALEVNFHCRTPSKANTEEFTLMLRPEGVLRSKAKIMSCRKAKHFPLHKSIVSMISINSITDP